MSKGRQVVNAFAVLCVRVNLKQMTSANAIKIRLRFFLHSEDIARMSKTRQT